jgi:hypothetical protein
MLSPVLDPFSGDDPFRTVQINLGFFGAADLPNPLTGYQGNSQSEFRAKRHSCTIQSLPKRPDLGFRQGSGTGGFLDPLSYSACRAHR